MQGGERSIFLLKVNSWFQIHFKDGNSCIMYYIPKILEFFAANFKNKYFWYHKSFCVEENEIPFLFKSKKTAAQKMQNNSGKINAMSKNEIRTLSYVVLLEKGNSKNTGQLLWCLNQTLKTVRKCYNLYQNT